MKRTELYIPELCLLLLFQDLQQCAQIQGQVFSKEIDIKIIHKTMNDIKMRWWADDQGKHGVNGANMESDNVKLNMSEMRNRNKHNKQYFKVMYVHCKKIRRDIF